MNAIVEQINSGGYAFVEFAVSMLIQVSVLIVLLFLADLVLRRRVRAVFRYWMWLLVLVKLVLPTSLSGPFSIGYWFGDKLEYADVGRGAYEPRASGPMMPALPYIDISNVPPAIYPPVTSAAPGEADPASMQPIAAPAVPPAQIEWQGIVFLLWLAVVMAMALLLAQRAVFVHGLVAQAREASRPMYDALEECRRNMKVRGKVGLKVSPNAASPAVCGLLRPVILVPQNLASALDTTDLRIVLLHELAHVKRGDLWVNLAQTLLQIVYFYNPLLWLANAVIRRAREQAVDEAVLVAMGERASRYPETLVSVAKLAFKRPALSLRLIGVVESKSALTARIKRILSRPIPKSAKLGILGLAVIVITAVIVLPMAKAQLYTDRARQVMALAEQEARRLKHEYIGTEHILLALAGQKDGVGGKVLDKLGIQKEMVESELAKLVRPGPKPITKGSLPQTPRAKSAIDYAEQEAKALDHDYIGTEHILLGLMREKTGIAAQMLAKLGVSYDVGRAEVLDFVKPGPNANGGDASLDAKVSLRVLDRQTHKPVGDCCFTFTGWGQVEKTNSLGIFSNPEDDFAGRLVQGSQLSLWHPDYDNKLTDGYTADKNGVVTVLLDKGGDASLEVKVSLTVRGKKSDHIPRVRLLNAEEKEVRRIESSPDSTFRFSGLAGGAYTIEAYFWDSYPTFYEKIQLSAGEHRNISIDAQTDEVARIRVAGRVINKKTNKGIEGLKIHFVGAPRDDVRTNKDGAFSAMADRARFHQCLILGKGGGGQVEMDNHINEDLARKLAIHIDPDSPPVRPLRDDDGDGVFCDTLDCRICDSAASESAVQEKTLWAQSTYSATLANGGDDDQPAARPGAAYEEGPASKDLKIKVGPSTFKVNMVVRWDGGGNPRFGDGLGNEPLEISLKTPDYSKQAAWMDIANIYISPDSGLYDALELRFFDHETRELLSPKGRIGIGYDVKNSVVQLRSIGAPLPDSVDVWMRLLHNPEKDSVWRLDAKAGASAQLNREQISLRMVKDGLWSHSTKQPAGGKPGQIQWTKRHEDSDVCMAVFDFTNVKRSWFGRGEKYQICAVGVDGKRYVPDFPHFIGVVSGATEIIRFGLPAEKVSRFEIRPFHGRDTFYFDNVKLPRIGRRTFDPPPPVTVPVNGKKTEYTSTDLDPISLNVRVLPGIAAASVQGGSGTLPARVFPMSEPHGNLDTQTTAIYDFHGIELNRCLLTYLDNQGAPITSRSTSIIAHGAPARQFTGFETVPIPIEKIDRVVLSLTDDRVLPGKEASLSGADWMRQMTVLSVGELIDVLAETNIGKDKSKWFAAIHRLVEIDAPAVPEIVAEIRRTEKPQTQSKLALTLRAIGDANAVPGLIDALERSGFSSDYGLGEPKTELERFYKTYQMEPAEESLGLGRPVREITIALERLTGHSEGYDHFDAYDSAGNRLGGYTVTPEIRDRQRQHRREVAEKWRVWCQANKDNIEPAQKPPAPPAEPKQPKPEGLEGGILTGPEGAQLTFAIVPNIDGSTHQPRLTKEQYQKYLDYLAEEGPFAGSIRGDSFQWSPVKGNAASFEGLPLSTYKDRTYILLCARAQYVMMPEVEGRWIWGLEKVEATSIDGSPAINIWFDEKAAELLGKLTKANIDNHVAVAVDGWVMMAPAVLAEIRKTATITGDFTAEEVRALVEDLQKGMPAVDQQAVEAMRRIAEAAEKLSKDDLLSMGPRQIVENLFVVGPARNAEKLAWFFRSDSPAAKGITVHDFAQMADAHKTEVLEVYADANDALAVTSNIKGKDGEQEGRLIFYLSKQTGTWLIHDADIGDPQRVQDDVTRFKNKHPNAKLDSSSQAVDSTPGEALRCDLKTEKPKVAFGEQPLFTATLTNAGSEPVNVMGYGDEPEGHPSYRLPLAGARLEIRGYGIQGYDAPGGEPKAVRIEAGKSWSFEMPPPRVPRYADEPAHPLPNLQAYLPGKHTAQVIYSIGDYEKERFGPTLVFGADAGALAGKKPDKPWEGTVRSNEVTFEVLEDDSEALRIRRAVDSGEGIRENLTLELTCPATQIEMGQGTQLNLTAKNPGSNMLYLGSNCQLRWKGPDGKEGSSLGLGAAEARQVGSGGSLVIGGWSFSSGQAPVPGTYQVWVEYTAGARPDAREAWVKSNVITLESVEPGSVPKSARPFSTTLPNGVTVEVVGICEYPSAGKQWWRPDGTPFTLPAGIKIEDSIRKAGVGDNAYQFLFRYNSQEDLMWNSLDALCLHFAIEGHSGTDLINLTRLPKGGQDGLVAKVAIFKEPLDSTTIQANLATGNWQTQAVRDISKIEQRNEDIYWFTSQSAGNTSLDILHRIEGQQIKTIAIDREGNEYGASYSLGSFNGWASISSIDGRRYVAGLRKDDRLVKFKLQSRPFWSSVIGNVSLKANFKTDVEIKVESEKISGVVGVIDSTLGKSTSAEAAFIIQKVLDRYAAIKTYSAIGELLTDVNHPPGAMRAIPGITTEMLQQMGEQQLKSIFTIKMARPNLYCIEWNENIDSDLSKVGNAWSVGDGSYGLILGKEKSFEKPLEALIWTAKNMGKVQSSLFFDTSLNTLRELRDLSQQEDEQLEGVECYVISGSRYRRTYTYWVSKKDFLIRRHKFVSGGDGKLIEGGGHEVTDETIKESLKAMDKEATPEEIAKTRAMLTAANAMASGVKVTNTETYRNIILDQPISKEQFVPSKDIDEITEELKNLRVQYIQRLENISPTESNLKTDVQVEVETPDEKAGLVWGEEVNGLRAAIEFEPEKQTYSIPEKIGVHFHIQNVSDKPIQFISESYRWEPLKIEDANGNRQGVRENVYSGLPPVTRHYLEPGREVVLRGLPLSIAQDEQQLESLGGPYGTDFKAKPGVYSVRSRLTIPGVISSSLPAQKDDWTGQLETGKHKLVVAVDPNSGNRPR